MYIQKPGRKSEKKPGRNSENLEKISKKPLSHPVRTPSPMLPPQTKAI